MFNDVEARVVGIELLYVGHFLLFLLLVTVCNRTKPDQHNCDHSPDNFHIPGEGLRELTFWHFPDNHEFDSASEDCHPGEGPKSMTVVILAIFEPFFRCRKGAKSPHCYAEHKKLMLGGNPEDELKEEVIAVDHEHKDHEWDNTSEIVHVL